MIHLKFHLYCIIVLDNNKVFISGSRILKNISVNAKWLAMAEIWPPYCFGSPGVKIMFWGVKTSKILTVVCVQAEGHSFFQIYFVFSE